MCIRHAILDALWSRHPLTVSLNRRRMWLNYSEASKTFDLPTLIPPMGSPIVKDRVGMGVAIVTLHASLHPGLYARHLQYQAMQKKPT